MTGPVLLVAQDRQSAHATVAEALRHAVDGAVIQLAPGTYEEELVITASVTLAAAGEAGSAHIRAPGGSAILAEAPVRLSGLVVSGADPEAPVIDVRLGAAVLDKCQVTGRAWAAVLAQQPGTVTLRDCVVGNDCGAGIVVASSGGNTVERTAIRDVASSGIVVAVDGRLMLRGSRIERPGGNGIIVNGQAHAVVEDTAVTGAVKPAVAVEEDAGADVTRLAVTSDTGPGAYLVGRGAITLTDCSFLVRDASQPAVLVADGAAVRGERLTVTGGDAGVRVGDRAILTLTDADVTADGDGIQVLDGGTLAATRCRLGGAGGQGLNVAPAGHADVMSCDIDADAGAGHEGDPGEADKAASAVPAEAPGADAAADPAADLELTPSMELIGALAGLESVRQAVTGGLADLVRVRSGGQPSSGQANLVFAGYDGSGRRAVAELYARALAELGFLRTGALDWAPLADFPARWQGQADRYADWLLARSSGGLLLLEGDETFARWPGDLRTRVLGAVPTAARRFPDAVIVLSGEPDLLFAALRDDPGLANCFPTYVRFDRYTPAELAELTIRRITARGCGIGSELRAALTGYFRQAEQAHDPRGPTGAWDAHRLADYLGETAPNQEITPADLFSGESPDQGLVAAPVGAASLWGRDGGRHGFDGGALGREFRPDEWALA